MVNKTIRLLKLLLFIIFLLNIMHLYAQPRDISDPLKPINKQSFKLYQWADKNLYTYIAKIYINTPNGALYGVRNIAHEFSELENATSSAVAFKPKLIINAVFRFFINYSFGGVGLLDASGVVTDYEKVHFSTALQTYGLSEGVYIYIPFAGPSSSTNLLSSITFSTLERIIAIPYAELGFISIIDSIFAYFEYRDEILAISQFSADKYSFYKSGFVASEYNEVQRLKNK